MPNVRGDKRRTIVIPDDLWTVLGKHATRAGVSKGAMLRSLIRYLDLNAREPVTDDEATRARHRAFLISESGEEPAEPA